MLTKPLLVTALAATAFSVSIPTEEKRASSVSSSIPNVLWKVTDFTRRANGPSSNIPCLFNDIASTPPASTTPQTHSYSALACHDAPQWQVNWGYNPNGDFAVMTVVDTAAGLDSFL
ncbi:hypothetical protein NHQ30_004883 [Ciborinia camelliae]|nr:hypothetical protein NHQ30_004883 [Ciborinia camelliae]